VTFPGPNAPFQSVVSPDGKNVYMTGFANNTLVVFQRDPVTGHLSYSQTLQQGVNGVNGLTHAQGVTINADGTQVFVAAAGGTAVSVAGTTFLSDIVLAVFNRNPSNGQLSLSQTISQTVPIAGKDAY